MFKGNSLKCRCLRGWALPWARGAEGARALWLVTSDRTLPASLGRGQLPELCRRGSVRPAHCWPRLGRSAARQPASVCVCQDTSIPCGLGAACIVCTSGRLTARRTRSCSWRRPWQMVARRRCSWASLIFTIKANRDCSFRPSPRRPMSECPAGRAPWAPRGLERSPRACGPRACPSSGGPRACPLERVCSVRHAPRGPGLVTLSVPCACVSSVCVCPCERSTCVHSQWCLEADAARDPAHQPLPSECEAGVSCCPDIPWGPRSSHMPPGRTLRFPDLSRDCRPLFGSLLGEPGCSSGQHCSVVQCSQELSTPLAPPSKRPPHHSGTCAAPHPQPGSQWHQETVAGQASFGLDPGLSVPASYKCH